MKSAIGIGALLMDGLGDTIRVSLTEVGAGRLLFCAFVLGLCCGNGALLRDGLVTGCAYDWWLAGCSRLVNV